MQTMTSIFKQVHRSLVSVNITIFRPTRPYEILLKCHDDNWSLPRDYLHKNEELNNAAYRVMTQHAGMKVRTTYIPFNYFNKLEQIGAFSDNDCMSIVYRSIVDKNTTIKVPDTHWIDIGDVLHNDCLNITDIDKKMVDKSFNPSEIG